ncbi:hypothetical protein HDV02_004346 [Globomyces sp. JEL0801]|nr:hypothetical protein HDV02_004346 [Globomyces sp. JEL0801]
MISIIAVVSIILTQVVAQDFESALRVGSGACRSALVTHGTAVSQKCLSGGVQVNSNNQPQSVLCTPGCIGAINNFILNAIKPCGAQIIFKSDNSMTANYWISGVQLFNAGGCIKSVDGTGQYCINQQAAKLKSKGIAVSGNVGEDTLSIIQNFPEDACKPCLMYEYNAANALNNLDSNIAFIIQSWGSYVKANCKPTDFLKGLSPGSGSAGPSSGGTSGSTGSSGSGFENTLAIVGSDPIYGTEGSETTADDTSAQSVGSSGSKSVPAFVVVAVIGYIWAMF